MMVNDDGVVILTSLSLRCCRLERFLWHCMALFAVRCSDFSCDMLCHTVPKFAEVSQSGLTSHSFSLILQYLILMEQKLALQILALTWALKVERSVGNIIRSYSNPVGWHSLGSKWLEPKCLWGNTWFAARMIRDDHADKAGAWGDPNRHASCQLTGQECRQRRHFTSFHNWLWFLLKSPSARKTFGDHLAATTTNTPEEAKICLQQAAKAWEQLPKECRNWG